MLFATSCRYLRKKKTVLYQPVLAHFNHAFFPLAFRLSRTVLHVLITRCFCSSLPLSSLIHIRSWICGFSCFRLHRYVFHFVRRTLWLANRFLDLLIQKVERLAHILYYGSAFAHYDLPVCPSESKVLTSFKTVLDKPRENKLHSQVQLVQDSEVEAKQWGASESFFAAAINGYLKLILHWKVIGRRVLQNYRIIFN